MASSSRAQRSIAQPSSYKEFSQSGHKDTIPKGAAIEQDVLMGENTSEENRDSSSGEADSVNTTQESGELVNNASQITQNSVESEVYLQNMQHGNSLYHHDQT